MASGAERLHPLEKGEAALSSFPPSHNVSVNCLEAMRARSPPRSDSAEDGELYGEAAAVALYRTWQEEHPSALESFETLEELARGKRLAVFLDYDGTLSPIVEDPDRAFMSEAMRTAVREVASHFPTAIISGRAREKVYDFVQLAELYYAGSHGMDIMGPVGGGGEESSHVPNGTASAGVDIRGNPVLFFQPASDFYPVMNQVYERLQRETCQVAGAWVENNKFCITIHFRRVSEKHWEELADIVTRVVSEYPRLLTTHGRKVLEVRPAVDWDKGKALNYLLRMLGMEEGEDVLPLYLGDDRTDEDAFSVLRDRKCGCGILVTTVAKATRASFSLRSPSEVMIFLEKLVKWRKDQIHEGEGL